MLALLIFASPAQADLINHTYWAYMGFPGGSGVKRLPAMQETWVRSLGQEDALEKEMATHSSTFAWKTPWTEKPLSSIQFSRSVLSDSLQPHES